MLRTTMILKMQGYWAVGSGKGGGNEVDNRIDRDSDGLPYVPGKMLKGLIRDACLRLNNAGNSKYDFVDCIFGCTKKSDGLNRTDTEKGKIYISDARLSPSLRSALKENAEARGNITRNIYSTAIDEKNGTADKGTLRGYEVAVPMELSSTVELNCEKVSLNCSEEEIFERIKFAASKFVYAVGSHKSRGLGEVVIEFKDEA